MVRTHSAPAWCRSRFARPPPFDRIEKETSVDRVDRDAARTVGEDCLRGVDDRADVAVEPHFLAGLSGGGIAELLALPDPAARHPPFAAGRVVLALHQQHGPAVDDGDVDTGDRQPGDELAIQGRWNPVWHDRQCEENRRAGNRSRPTPRVAGVGYPSGPNSWRDFADNAPKLRTNFTDVGSIGLPRALRTRPTMFSPNRTIAAVAAAFALVVLFPSEGRAQTAGKSRVVINLGTTGFGSATGNWGSNVSKTKQGLFIHGEATGEGSVGGKDLTLDLGEDTFLEFVLAVGPDNAMAKLKLVLRDADGTEVVWTVGLDGLTPQTPKNFRLELDKPDETPAPGTEAGFNKKAVVAWRIEGDGSGNAAQALLMMVLAGK